jgi:hypothetical protein
MQERIMKLGKSNPGALNVLCRMYNKLGEEAAAVFDIMEDMNIIGSSVWLAYKDSNRENLDATIDAIKRRDPEMVKVINRWAESPAVVSGAKK